MRILLILLVILPVTALAEVQEKAWSAYRAQSPLLDQSIVVVHEPELEETLIILTEPPAVVLAERDTAFSEEFPKRLKSVEVFTQRIGVDGSVKDILLTFEQLDENALSEIVSRLSILLYGTDYKANYKLFQPGTWSLDIEPLRQVSAPNLSVGPRDIGAWLFDDAIAFEPLAGERPLPNGAATAIDLLDQGGGVYRSVQPGLTFLVIDRAVPLNDQVVQLRKFLVDSDLILAAVVNDRDDPRRLGIVGRERDESLDSAPPLRIDTVLTLAANRSENLAQSYERNMPFAGRAVTAIATDNIEFLDSALHRVMRGYGWGADWAPILLSRELTHTEYGHILNITDQMLKGWSLAGDIQYANFPYRAPAVYPDQFGLWTALEAAGNEIEELTFNWNTAGSAFWAEYGEFFIMTMPMTGALPVSYIPDLTGDDVSKSADDIRAAEDRYFAFFAELRDPLLIRVAQYAALHQLFQRYPVKAQRTEPIVNGAEYAARWSGLAELTKMSLLASAQSGIAQPVTSAEGCGLQYIAENLPSDAFTEMRMEVQNALLQFHGDELGDVAEALVDFRKFLDERFPEVQAEERKLDGELRAFDKAVDAYNARVEACQESAFVAGCQTLDLEFSRLEARNSELTEAISRLDTISKDRDNFLARLEQLQSNRNLGDVLKLNGSCEAAIVAILDGPPDSDNSVYVTPSIVISVPWADWSGEGGHNLDGRTVDVRVDASLQPGQIQIDPNGNIIRVPPGSEANMANIARDFERRRVAYLEGSPRFRTKFESDLAALTTRPASPPKPFSAATLLRSTDTGNGRGARKFEGDQLFFVDAIKIEPETAKMVELLDLATAQSADIVLTRSGKELLVLDRTGNPPVVYKTHSPSAALSKVHEISTVMAQASGDVGPIRIVTEGISAAEVQVNTRVLSLKDRLEAGARIATGGGSGKPPGGSNITFLFPDGPGDGGGGVFKRMLTLREGDPIRLAAFFRRRTIDWDSAVIETSQLNGNRVVNSIELTVANQPSRVRVLFRAIFGRNATVEDGVLLDEALNLAFENAKLTDSQQIGHLITANREEFLKHYEKGAVNFEIEIRAAPESFVVTDLKEEHPKGKSDG